ncbi:TetR/AcrR family transcriptional regulator [Antrihabitans cavernicola]|uniref:TetR/AcrR family transcriptional regulator n=1 Tax=Antrihabitans cavernicola TaxID=2495913 RepID=A0A5A7S869_9NOCA|nr:TetR/AcrR family transcriptional regulator [Spelaeibacter cavernicola]KAA0022116.1 TetR/AcrR family transcriptional regulator [Spelaeibacter cavernicola]
MTNPDVPGNGTDARLRLIDAMATVVAEKGYPATTIAHVVAEARVSRRTFYEHFTDKQACMIACYSTLSDRLLAGLSVMDTDSKNARSVVASAVDSLLRVLAERPDLTYAQFVAIHAAGLTTSPERRRVQDILANQIRDIAVHASEFDANVRVPSDLTATLLVGGIGELIVRSVEQGRVDRLSEIAPTVVDVVSAVLLEQ